MRRAVVIDLFAALARGKGQAKEEPMPDAELVRRALSGERWAEEAIFRKHARHAGNIAARLLRCRADAEDVLQDTFTIVLRDLESLRDPAKLRGWIAQITVSQARRRFRRKRMLRMLGIDGSLEDVSLAEMATEGTSEGILASLRDLDVVLGRLPHDQRMAWVLRHVEGFELTEVASALECSLATVKRRLAEADLTVRAHVTLDEEGDARP